MSQNTVQHMEENEIEKPDNHTSIRQLQREMEIHITNDEFKIDTEVFSYFSMMMYLIPQMIRITWKSSGDY